MYRLIRTAERRSERPLLDESQLAVVAHPGGPLLVLAGPGTGRRPRLSSRSSIGSSVAAPRQIGCWC